MDNTVWFKGPGGYAIPMSPEMAVRMGVDMEPIIREEDSNYCHMQWNPNWNGEPMLSTAHVMGHALWMGTVQGLMIIDLDEEGSVEAFCKQLRGAADQAESIKKRYLTDGYLPPAMIAWYDTENGDEDGRGTTESSSARADK